jgi:hypothetical protein
VHNAKRPLPKHKQAQQQSCTTLGWRKTVTPSRGRTRLQRLFTREAKLRIYSKKPRYLCATRDDFIRAWVDADTAHRTQPHRYPCSTTLAQSHAT